MTLKILKIKYTDLNNTIIAPEKKNRINALAQGKSTIFAWEKQDVRHCWAKRIEWWEKQFPWIHKYIGLSTTLNIHDLNQGLQETWKISCLGLFLFFSLLPLSFFGSDWFHKRTVSHVYIYNIPHIFTLTHFNRHISSASLIIDGVLIRLV